VSNLLLFVYEEFGANSNKFSDIDRAVSLALSEFVKFISYCYFSIWVIKCCLKSIDELFIGSELDYARDGIHMQVELGLDSSREVRNSIRNFVTILYISGWV